ncbi:TRL domain-containing protein [Leptospira meyeri]|uniref:TRL domain-containing protein n=1 Tax=Leptospira meyeri TaxID=29508 RepID=UPI0010831335|nr:TRL domain-containing protein [Leptospira meyeri]TGL12514.1 TRL-like family protein [Leptospira meyeri]
MKNLIKVLGILIIAGFFANCSVQYTTPPGYLFQNITMNKDVSTGNDIGTKTGTACTHGVLSIFYVGDGGIGAAAEQGGIKVVKAVDYSRLSLLTLLYSRVCTIARGD